MKEELTLTDLMELLKNTEETYLIELLQLDSEILVERFQDIIEDKFDDLQSEIERLYEDGQGE